MKAVIVEIKDSVVAVLSDDGCIVTMKNNNYEIGQVIQMSNPKIRFTKKITAFAASAAALVVISVGTWAYASPYTYVSLDVNPSIEYTVNRFDRVLNVKAVNDDGEEILSEIKLDNLENKTIQEALINTVEKISELGYFDGDIEGGIIIATSGKDLEKAEELAQELQQTVENEVADNGDVVEVEAISVGLERVEQARELGVTPGKLNLVEKLQASATDPTTIILGEWLDKPVKEIMKAAKDFKKPTSVSGSAIILEDKEIDKVDKAAEKAKEAEVKALEKATKTQNKASEKASDAEERVTEKAKEAEERVIEKAKEAEEKAIEKATDATEKASDKAIKNKNDEVEKTQEAVENDDAKKAIEAAENATAETEKTSDKNNEAENANDKTTDKDNSTDENTENSNGNNGRGNGHN